MKIHITASVLVACILRASFAEAASGTESGKPASNGYDANAQRVISIASDYPFPAPNFGSPFESFMLAALNGLRSSIADWNDVPSNSMAPSILPGDRIFVNKLAYDLKVPFTNHHSGRPWCDPQRGDLVVFFSPDDGTRLVKRCVAVGGDTVEVAGDYVFIKGQHIHYDPPDPKLTAHVPLDPSRYDYVTETLGTHVYLIQKLKSVSNRIMQAHRSFSRQTVPAGEIFVLGDNRDNSRDSRYFFTGPFVPQELIVGRATDVVISFDRDHGWRPRWSRFFTKLP